MDLSPVPFPNGKGSLLPPRSGRAGVGFVRADAVRAG
jgi:hypothetical protein